MSTAEPKIGQLAKEVPARRRADRGLYERIKPSLDFVAALALLIVTAPLMMVAMLLVRLSSRGPAIYTQQRLGLHGRVFTIYKIRTMHHDCERQGGATWSRPGDPRVTWVGRGCRLPTRRRPDSRSDPARRIVPVGGRRGRRRGRTPGASPGTSDPSVDRRR